MIGLARRLKAAGVVGMNARNAAYIMEFNERRYYPLVDDKRQTKLLAAGAGLPVPELYGVIEFPWQARGLAALVEGREGGFVVKPANGSQGDGITVIEGRDAGGWRKVGGATVADDDMAFYLSNILSGMYSLGGQPDSALVEYRVRFDPVFDHVTYKGVPDVRVIVYRGVPAFAMLRLPTRESDGKANLHKGGIGAGVDIATGVTTTAVLHDNPASHHPDTGEPIGGIAVPGWERILQMSARSAELCHLGYLGVDIVLDETLGPLILELNARPGLAIQIANRVGMATRFRQIEAALPGLGSLDERVAYARTELSGAVRA